MAKTERTLPRVAVAHADVARMPGLDDVVQRTHGLFDGCVFVEHVACKRGVVSCLVSGEERSRTGNGRNRGWDKSEEISV